MMLKVVVCIKQVPMVTELPWDASTGSLKRNMAEGMMNPACKHALEAAIQIKSRYGAYITALSMGPAAAEEVLREALAMGADQGILLTDSRMAGADTLITSHALALAIKKECPDFDLILCGCYTSDSETAQVGPQLTEELDVAGAAYAADIQIMEQTVRIQRECDDFLETLEMETPCLITVATRQYMPRYASLSGLQDAFEKGTVKVIHADDIGMEPEISGTKTSPTRIVEVYSPTARKKNIMLKGTALKMVEMLFEQFGDRLSGAMAKDIKTHDHDDEHDEIDNE